MKKIFYINLVFLFLLSCSGLVKYEKTKEYFQNTEFEKKVTIVEEPEPVLPEAVEVNNKSDEVVDNVKTEKTIEKTKTKLKTKSLQAKSKKKSELLKKIAKRQPDIEDSEGFDGQRRPLTMPFWVGEKVIHEVSYLGATAGTLTLQVKPYATVNNKKNFNFFIDVKSTSFFSRIFAVDDQIQTYLDYNELVPGVLKLDIRDSVQVKEARSFFDFINLKADYWEHKYTEEDGHQEKKFSWDILPYSQNAFSAIFYMRVFKWSLDKEYSFRVADDKKNVIFKAKAIEKTKIKTDAGTFDAIKLKAEVVSRGNLSKARDFYLWLSDDDRKFILKIEVKLPVGSLVSEVIEIQKGINEQAN